MPERLTHLREVVAELEEQLASLESIDAETVSLLQDATREIQEVLQQQGAETLEQEPLAERLQHAAETFQATHPTLSGVVMRAVDALRQLGI